MAEDAKKTYKLYALPLTAGNIGKAAEERFCRATPTPAPGYVLIYTDGNPAEHALRVTEEFAKLLTQADIRWLMDCNAAIFAEEVEKNRDEVMHSLSDSVEFLEAELKRRKEELETKGE